MKRFGVITIALVALLVAAMLPGRSTTTTTAQEEVELGNLFAVNPSVCVALMTTAAVSECLSFATGGVIAIGNNRTVLVGTMDDRVGDDDGEITREEVNVFNRTGTHIHSADGSLLIIAFVDDDNPVKFETNVGNFQIAPGVVADDFVCDNSAAGTLTGDEDCDHDGTEGDGVLFAQLIMSGEDQGPGRVTAFDTITGEVVGDFFFEVVGDADDLLLGAFETTIAGGLPDVNGDTNIDGGDCPLPTTVEGFTEALGNPNKTVIIARAMDNEDDNIIGSWVRWTVDDPDLAVLAGPETPTLDLGSFGFGAPQALCGLDGPGEVVVRGEFVSGALGLGLDPVFETDDFELTITLLGTPSVVNLTVTPAVLNCDGVATAEVSASILTDAGDDAANGTEVGWSVQVLGTANPLTSTYADGIAKTVVTPFAASNTGVPVIASVGPRTFVQHPLETEPDGRDDDGDGPIDEPGEFDVDIDIIVDNPDFIQASTLVQCGAGSGAAPPPPGGGTAPPPGSTPGTGTGRPGGSISGPDTGSGGDAEGRGALAVWPAVALLVGAMGLAGARYGIRRAS